MEINKILNADVLDIIFDGKNKDYGAYQLRKYYNKRLAKALMTMAGVLLVFFVGSVLASALDKNKDENMSVKAEIILENIAKPEKPIAPPPPPPPQPLPAPPPQVKMNNLLLLKLSRTLKLPTRHQQLKHWKQLKLVPLKLMVLMILELLRHQLNQKQLVL